MKNQQPDWNDIRLFLAVAQAGSLSAAARQERVGIATVGRRVHALEEALGVRLFDRLPEGYALTAEGRDFVPMAEEMRGAAEAMRRRSDAAGEEGGTVRLIANDWDAGFLASRWAQLMAALPGISLEVAQSHMPTNLARRDADLAIVTTLPATGELIARKLRPFAYGVYGARRFLEVRPEARAMPTDPALADPALWVGLDGQHQYFPVARWLARQLAAPAAAGRTNNHLLVRDLVASGAGLGVLACFAGDADPTLERLGPPIAELSEDRWLLVHADLKRVPRIRRTIDALARLFDDAAAALAGRLERAP
ncbi:LysR family transcriptional regulator [Aliidongia dinghuensis]|uniref:LysR family transcriptional regulator n=1 Tax=Aliidongia dinghuensis TaxID=1867774 RepID=A0A8J2YQL2_9PROT|nr:LysR family transcriptional regulator [Aliidongia dinghuensis]GGF08913.1 LysR family transcriptional regulator [Aliidongia dinghuensis]